MARNRVENHIQQGGLFTFGVNTGQTVKIGQIVELQGDRLVGVAGAGSRRAVGVVYSGTVGIDGVTDGYSGDEGHKVTVVILKPFVYLTAGGAITAGDMITSNANGNAVTHTDSGTYVAGEFKSVIGMAITGAANGEDFIAVLK